MKCSGLNFATGELVEIGFDSAISRVEPLLESAADPPLLAPGFIDLQVNGYAGADFNSPETVAEQVSCAVRALRAVGVARFFPTVITGPFERMVAALGNLARIRETIPEGASIEAIHLEGPYISPEDGPRGAHPRQWVRPPDLDEFKRFQEAAGGLIRLVTVAPEWPSALRFIEVLTGSGVVVSLGHTRASAEQIRAAIEAGASVSTHLGNAAETTVARRSNCLWEQLADDRLTACFIVDDFHLETSFLKVALRAKGVERSVLVSDAAAPAGRPPGVYRMGELDVTLGADGSIKLPDGRLAGSAINLKQAVENVMRRAAFGLRDAVVMATVNAARAGRLSGRLRGLAVGERADIIQFRFDRQSKIITIEKIFVGGVPCEPQPC